MDLQLHRLDLLQCGALQPGTLEVLPVGKKKQQKIAVGAGKTGKIFLIWEDWGFGKIGEISEEGPEF